MKNNNLSIDSFRGAWAINPANVSDCESILKLALSTQILPQPKSTTEMIAGTYLESSNGSQREEQFIAVITMTGLMMAYDGWMWTAQDYLQIFRYYNNNDRISAVVIHMNGPGSQVDAINMMREFAAEKKKPFVVLANSCLSGHLWTACLFADHIMAYGELTSSFGSIGVLSMNVDSREAWSKEGFKMQIIRAPQSTTKAQDTVDYYEGNDEAFVKSMKDSMKPMVDVFIKDVTDNRPNLKLDTPGLFTGSIYSAKEALEIGLIDSIGNEKKALEIAQMLVDLEIY